MTRKQILELYGITISRWTLIIRNHKIKTLRRCRTRVVYCPKSVEQVLGNDMADTIKMRDIQSHFRVGKKLVLRILKRLEYKKIKNAHYYNINEVAEAIKQEKLTESDRKLKTSQANAAIMNAKKKQMYEQKKQQPVIKPLMDWRLIKS